MKIFCDIDGVLTDFPRAYNERFGLKIPLGKFNEEEFPLAVGKDARQIDAELDFDFWAKLPWMPHGQKFLYYLEQIFGSKHICLLSFPSYSPDGPMGKIAWVKRELPAYEMRLLLAMDKRFCASPDAILFDDKPRNVEEFRAAGGRAILVPAPWNGQPCVASDMLEFMQDVTRMFSIVNIT